METRNKMIITLDDLVLEFAQNISFGMKAIEAAAQTYVTAIHKYGERARTYFSERFSTIRPATWQIIEDVGNGRLPPQSTMMTSGAVDKIRAAGLPRKLMVNIAESKVSVYNPTTCKYNDVPFSYLTEGQADILLNPVTHSIRTAAQQKRYVERLRKNVNNKPVAIKERKNWAIVSDGIIFRKGARISFEELRIILTEAGEMEEERK
jgi:hypothetical protein